MKQTLAAACLLAILGACQAQLASPYGQLFCQIQTAGGGAVIVGVIDAEATAMAPAGAPVAIFATNMGKAYVDAACAQAARNQGGTAGTPVSPPPVPVGNVAIAATTPVNRP